MNQPVKFAIAAGAIATVMALVLGTSATVSYRYYEAAVLPRLSEARTLYQTNLPRFVQDVLSLDQRPPFPDGPRLNNAEPFLTAHVSWLGQNGRSIPQSQALSAEFRSKYSDWARNRVTLLRMLQDLAFFRRYDTAWMDALEKYDHWNPWTYPNSQLTSLSAEQIVNLPGAVRVGLFAALPVPNYEELSTWAIFTAFKRGLAGDPVRGLRLLRKVAQLCHSSSTLIGVRTAALLLGQEKEFAQNFPQSNWRFVPEDVISAYHRSVRAWRVVAQAPWFGEFPAELEDHLHPQVGLCAGVWELPSGPVASQDYLDNTDLFQTNVSEFYRAFRQRQKRLLEICGLSRFEPFIAPPSPKSSPWILVGAGRTFAILRGTSETPPKSGFEINVAHVPFVRRVLGWQLFLRTVSDDDWKYYR